jgi:hypothetical protein
MRCTARWLSESQRLLETDDLKQAVQHMWNEWSSAERVGRARTFRSWVEQACGAPQPATYQTKSLLGPALEALLTLQSSPVDPSAGPKTSQ